jgi:hypothetical protein
VPKPFFLLKHSLLVYLMDKYFTVFLFFFTFVICFAYVYKCVRTPNCTNISTLLVQDNNIILKKTTLFYSSSSATLALRTGATPLGGSFFEPPRSNADGGDGPVLCGVGDGAVPVAVPASACRGDKVPRPALRGEFFAASVRGD